MRIFTFSKHGFDTFLQSKGTTRDNVEEKKNVFFISINDSPETTPEVPYLENTDNVKVLTFDDVEQDTTSYKRGLHYKAMSPEQALELVQFIHQHLDKKLCLIHCSAGVARSGAVATFIHQIVDSNKDQFQEDNPFILPNPYVLNLLQQANQQFHSGWG